jgi:hypothetical protein
VLEYRATGAGFGAAEVFAKGWFKNDIIIAPPPVSQEPVRFQQNHSVEEQEETEKTG